MGNTRTAIPAAVLLFVFAAGTFLEIGWCAKTSYGTLSVSGSKFHGIYPKYVVERSYKAIARDSSIKRYDPSPYDCPGIPSLFCAHFNAEKFMNVPIDYMETWEHEFLRRPKSNRFW